MAIGVAQIFAQQIQKNTNNMKTLQLTTSKLCALIIFLAFFMNWASVGFGAISGYDIWHFSVSPGMAASAFDVKGLTRIALLLLILLPLSAALYVWQTSVEQPNPKLAVWVKRAPYIPVVICLLLFVGTYLKIGSAQREAEAQLAQLGSFRNMIPAIETPGMTDFLDLGAYLTILAALYFALLGMKKTKDTVLWTSGNK